MTRLLLLFLLAGVVYLLIRSFRRQGTRTPEIPPQEMVSCKHCGVHLPKGEAIMATGHYFCSEAHRLAYASRTDKT